MSKQETLEEVKDLSYWKANAEEDYMKVPISVLRYISELEERSYSEKEVYDLMDKREHYWVRYKNYYLQSYIPFDEWFEQFKKK